MDYEERSHPPIIGFVFDGIALFGKYQDDSNLMAGANETLDEFGGHSHDDYEYHYHAKLTIKINTSNKPTIVLMTRWHGIYRCKSRLSKDIGAFKAAKIQEKLTIHTINVAKKIQKEGVQLPWRSPT